MKIQLVSYLLTLSCKTRVKLTADIINASKADFIFFSGDTVKSLDDAFEVARLTQNKKSTALIEVSSVKTYDLGSIINHCPFLIKKGELINMHTYQLFATSASIEGNGFLAEAFVHELETNRRFKVGKYNCLLLECGENNIIRNIQSEDNKPEIRIDDLHIATRFENVINATDIVLNIIHKPQYGNQNKLQKRREYLSYNGRYYFSTNNCNEISEKLKSVQYAYSYGKPIEPIISKMNDKCYITRTYLLPSNNYPLT